MLAIIENGLPKPETSLTITIAGAETAGLIAASLLKKAGLNVRIIEPNNRVGG
ncbi:NAD(P)-binding protein [Halobacillus andaensis]|uniref:NAD(P)-binding protein n=1 Tax=Halobacillus andaensis TaxID=1176239 RepID=UPI003D719FE9